MESFSIRQIDATDNQALAIIIRQVLTEFGANKPGTVYYDATTDALFELFQFPKAYYYVAFYHDKLVGGAGIFPTKGLPDGTCELVKMYLTPEARGTGIARAIINRCLETASEEKFTSVYLETMPELSRAVHVYRKFGFEFLTAPMGASGHFGCDLWMLKKL